MKDIELTIILSLFQYSQLSKETKAILTISYLRFGIAYFYRTLDLIIKRC